VGFASCLRAGAGLELLGFTRDATFVRGGRGIAAKNRGVSFKMVQAARSRAEVFALELVGKWACDSDDVENATM
jgi:hypothetical protein